MRSTDALIVAVAEGSGAVQTGDRRLTLGPGDVVVVPNWCWRRFSAGPDGCVLFEVMMGDPRSFPGDLEAYEKFLADEGVEQLPNPPIDMPDWLPDTRN